MYDVAVPSRPPGPDVVSDDAHKQRPYGAMLVWAVALVLAFRFYWVVSRFSVNLFFFDEWDIYEGLFRAWHWWQFFVEEHGPHRQGVGVTVVVWLLRATHWDSRVQAYAIAAAIVTAMLSALALKTSLYGRLQFSDVIIPILFLGLGQWEVLLSAPGPSAQAFPLLLLMLYCVMWRRNGLWPRYTGIVLINFLMIYTGYGIFVSVITLLLLAVDCWKAKNERAARVAPLAALMASTLALASFFHGYKFNPAADCFQFPFHDLAAYPLFMGMMLARFLGIKHGTAEPAIIGLVALGLLVAAGLRSLWTLLKDTDSDSRISFILTAFTLIYAAAAAVGRVCMGMQAAASSRNITLLIPGFLGIYFYLLNRKDSNKVKIAIYVLLLAVVPACLQRNHKEIEGFSAMKAEWKQCYLAHENVEYCDSASHLQIYPKPSATHLDEKLAYLKRKGLNLYSRPDRD